MQIRLSINNRYSQIDTASLKTLAAWLIEQFSKVPGYTSDWIRVEAYPTYTPTAEKEDWTDDLTFVGISVDKPKTPEEFCDMLKKEIEYIRTENADHR